MSNGTVLSILCKICNVHCPKSNSSTVFESAKASKFSSLSGQLLGWEMLIIWMASLAAVAGVTILHRVQICSNAAPGHSKQGGEPPWVSQRAGWKTQDVAHQWVVNYKLQCLPTTFTTTVSGWAWNTNLSDNSQKHWPIVTQRLYIKALKSKLWLSTHFLFL